MSVSMAYALSLAVDQELLALGRAIGARMTVEAAGIAQYGRDPAESLETALLGSGLRRSRTRLRAAVHDEEKKSDRSNNGRGGFRFLHS